MNVVYKTIPRHTEEKIPLDQHIEIYFMIDINKNSIRPEGLVLLNLTEQTVEPVTFTYQRRVLVVTPTSKLLPNNHYQLQLVGGEKGLKDITGRGMAQTYEVEFYTKDIDAIKPPVVLSPTDMSIVREAVKFQLKPSMDVEYYEMQISKSNTFQNLVWPTDGEKVYRTDEISIIPDIAYETGTYFMRVRSVDAEGLTSSWSSTLRYHYDGVPLYALPGDQPIEAVTMALQPTRKVVLQAMSQLQTQPDQLSKLQDAFLAKSGTTLTGLYVKSATPKDKSVNNQLARFNDTRVGMNNKQIIIEFTDDIDPATVTDLTCYVLSERN